MINAPLKERVYAAVLDGIVSGEYTPDALLSEKQLTEKLHVSKSPVREALVELCAQGVLKSAPRQGYRVVRFTERNVRDILEFRTMLEVGCLRACFDKITPVQIRRLQSIVECEFLHLTRQDLRDYWTNTLNFHLTLASYAENEYIYKHLSTLLNTSMRAYLQLYWRKWEDGTLAKPSVLHAQIVESIANRDREEALRLLERDINTFTIEPVGGNAK